MKVEIVLVGSILLGLVVLGCASADLPDGTERKAPRMMGGTGYEFMEDAEKADGTAWWKAGKADPRAQKEMNKNRDATDDAVDAYREESGRVDETITEQVGEKEEPPPEVEKP